MREFLDEWDYLIHLIRCAIHGEQPRELPEALDFQRVYEYGVYHHVANIAFYSVERLATKPQSPLYAKWEACRDKAIVRDINQTYAAGEIRTALQAAGIRSLEVQGTKIKPLYPQPEYRTMSDIDFIIDSHRLARAKAVLEELGYQCRDVHGVEVDGFRAPNINIELHAQYFPETSEFHGLLPPPFASVEATGEYDISDFYLYNILHIAKHYLYGGCGIRRVLDLYYLNQNYAHRIRRRYVKSVLKAAKITALTQDLSELASGWFDQGELPPGRSDTASYILKSGLHGNSPNELDNRLKRSYDPNTRFSGLKYWLRRFLGTRKILVATYPILKRHKLLYPVCWLHRAFRGLRPGKIKQLRREMKAVTAKKRQQ